MGIKMLNPYNDVSAVRNPTMFFGRSRLLRRLYSAIANRQCIAIVGPRHLGKSSVLSCMRLPELQAKFEHDLSHHALVFIDLREYLQKTSDDFFEAVSRQILLQSRLQLTVAPGTMSGEDEFSYILDLVKEQGVHPVLLMDAFDNITRNTHFDPEFFAFLRAQATMGKVSYVTASIAPLSEVCHHDIQDSPFFNIFGICYLEPLTMDEARALVSEPALREDLPFTEQEIGWILALTGRHPFFIQRVCHYLFEEKASPQHAEIDYARARALAYKELRPHFEDTWRRLDVGQQELLKLEAQRRGKQVRDALPELSESSLFRKFVRDICNIQVFRMTVEDVEAVLDKIDDARFLGESELKHLNSISRRLKKDSVPSVIERGMVIREVLNEAFERLRGNGVRKDAASEWRPYNILYYRYFKNHLKNEQIAARLEFTSTRQYFRERNKAIEALFNTLLEMEVAAQEHEDD